MKIERREREYPSSFSEVKVGQVFEGPMGGSKVWMLLDAKAGTAVALDDGSTGIWVASDYVRILDVTLVVDGQRR